MNSPKSILLVLCTFWLLIVGRTSQKTITLGLKSFHDGQLFYTPMTVGRGEYEKAFKMLVATSYQMTWIVSTEISTHHGYDDRSSVGRIPGRFYSTPTWYGFFNYYVYNDTWKVNSRLEPLNNQPFAVLYPFPGHSEGMIEVDGVLGLNDGTSEPDNIDYLFKNLYKSHYIEHLMYSFYINYTAVFDRLTSNDDIDDESQPEGALVVGGIDDKYYTGPFKYAKMHDDSHLDSPSGKSLYISNIRLNWSRVSGDELNDNISGLEVLDKDMDEVPFRLESNLILYYGERQTLDRIHLEMLNADSIIRNSFYAFKDCRLDNKPDIVFTLKDGFDLTITPEEYVIEQEIDNLKVCLSAFKPSRDTVWVFGTRFMRKYYTVFDYENDRVGFARPA